MKNITSIVKKILSKDMIKPVGRWKIENCDKKMNLKIDLSNEGHCGPCGQYVLEKIKLENNKISKIHLKN